MINTKIYAIVSSPKFLNNSFLLKVNWQFYGGMQQKGRDLKY
jgi:hypothetical protein